MNVLLVLPEAAAAERQLLEGFFQKRNHQVVVSTSCEAARGELAGNYFSYVLIDLEAGPGAADLCQTIRELPHGERTYSLVLPASETIEAMRSALAAGADDYVAKPIGLAALQLRLAIGERHLSRRQRNVEVARRLEEAERDLGFREQYFRSLLENSSDLITVVDAEGNVLYQSASSENMMGIPADDLMGAYFFGYLHPDDRSLFNEVFTRAVENPGTVISGQFRLRRGEEWPHFESLLTNLLDDPVVAGVVLTSRDITEHRRMAQDLQRERVFFQQLFRNSPSGITILDPEDRIIDANRSFLDLFRLELDVVKKQKINDLIVPEELREEAAELSQAIFGDRMTEHETTRKRSDGSAVEVSIVGYPIEVLDRRIGAFNIYSDITQRKNAERKLFHHAFHDALTGLPNRMLLNERLERALRRVERTPEYRFALLFIDLDRFKVINDSLGHRAGDDLLIEMAKRLEKAVRPGDTTARLGGDEFTVILDSLSDPADATRIAERILDLLGEPFQAGGEEVANTCSIGVAYSSPRYENAEDLVRDADIAMYRAKAAGKARYAIFDEEMHKSAMVRLQLETELRRAIEQEALEMYYLPLVSLRTRRITGFEALVRWSHPRRGLVTASDLIPICEETGLVVPLGRWVFRQVFQQVAAWQARFPESDCVFVTINLSAKETSQGDFLEAVVKTARETGVKTASIGFELGESLIASADDSIHDTLWELHRKGFRLYVDEFGTGNSALASLYRFPVHSIKIDRSLIRHATPGSGTLEVVRAIGALGESLGLSVIAEGIEDRDRLMEMIKLELPYGQGFFFTRPVPPEVAEKMFESEMWTDENDDCEMGREG